MQAAPESPAPLNPEPSSSTTSPASTDTAPVAPPVPAQSETTLQSAPSSGSQ
jgi:hypothetical protein